MEKYILTKAPILRAKWQIAEYFNVILVSYTERFSPYNNVKPRGKNRLNLTPNPTTTTTTTPRPTTLPPPSFCFSFRKRSNKSYWLLRMST
jgi:hypothetical protein